MRFILTLLYPQLALNLWAKHELFVGPRFIIHVACVKSSIADNFWINVYKLFIDLFNRTVIN